MKFKVGDKVRLLPSATESFISEKDVGKMGRIIAYQKPFNTFKVKMDRWRWDSDLSWVVRSDQMELVIETGQMLFNFMKD